MKEEIEYDRMQASDAEQVSVLAAQLGYPADAREIRARIELFASEPSEQLRVARLAGRTVGWVHFQLERSLATGDRVHLASIVVEEKLRGRGIGARLVALAEEWGRAQGIPRIRLASRATRADAHRLYLRLGYAISKTSHFFEKPLLATGPDGSL